MPSSLSPQEQRRKIALERLKLISQTKPDVKDLDAVEARKRATFLCNRTSIAKTNLHTRTFYKPRRENNPNNITRGFANNPVSRPYQDRSQILANAALKNARMIASSVKSEQKTVATLKFTDTTTRFADKRLLPKKTYIEKPNRSKLKPVKQNSTIGKQILGKLDSEEDLTSLDSHINRNDRYKKSRKRLKLNETKPKKIDVFNGIFASSLASAMSVSLEQIAENASSIGIDTSITESSALDVNTASLIVESFGNIYVQKANALDKMELDLGQEKDYVSKCPVVSVVGHVDHGKTSLLDSIRSTNVVSKESGGITQGIGASKIEMGTNQFITFIDTPGHEIFTTMRSKGVGVADITLLIIAADSGIQDQTIESIKHIQNAKTFFIVVITKCDLTNANPEKVKKSLMQYEIFVESLGGDVPDIEVSAHSGSNIKKLLELILTYAELNNLRANHNLNASGIVLEASIDKRRGILVTVIIQSGTLNRGEHFVVGNYDGKVKLMHDANGKVVQKVIPGEAVQIMGANSLPSMGDKFVVMLQQEAKSVVERQNEIKTLANLVQSVDKKQYNFKDIINTLLKRKGLHKEFNYIIKADSTGSAEAVVSGFTKADFLNYDYSVISYGAGSVTENDITLAKTSNATIIAFRVEVPSQISKLSNMESVNILRYDVIYKIFEDLSNSIHEFAKPKEKEVSIGYAEVREVFIRPKIGPVAGCFVKDGVIKINAKSILFRNGKQIYSSHISSLKRFKEDKKEIKSNYDCGIMMDKFSDYKVGDKIECFEIVSTN